MQCSLANIIFLLWFYLMVSFNAYAEITSEHYPHPPHEGHQPGKTPDHHHANGSHEPPICTISSDQATAEVDVMHSVDVNYTILATITFICTYTGGYTITFKSPNNGRLQNGDESLIYYIKLGEHQIIETLSGGTISLGYASPTPITGNTIVLYFGFTGLAFPTAGEWSDTITITIRGYDYDDDD